MTEKAKLMDLAKHIIRNFGNSSDLTAISVADIPGGKKCLSVLLKMNIYSLLATCFT